MLNLLAKIFIKDRKNFKNPQVRNQYGILCGIVGICFNIFLFAFKFFAGILSNSVAVVADAFNNLSDATGSIVTILGFKISGKKPDAEHPFGHGRMEYIAGLIVSFLIIIMGYELLKSSVGAIKNPEPLKTDFLTIIILSVSILVKFYMYFYNHSLSKKMNSVVMEATAKDSLNDTISTGVVLAIVIINIIFSSLGKEISVPLDGFAGLFVAIFILKGGFDSVKETVDPLLGKNADKEFVDNIEKTVMAHRKICGMHDLVLHDYGPEKIMVSFHAEVPGDENIFELHDEIDNIECEISKKFNCSCVIHMDPIDKNNAELEQLKNFIIEKAKNVEPNISIHDLRIVPGPSHTNVIFDAVRPFESKYSEDELKELLCGIVKEYNSSYFAVIQIDQPFI
ncbi:MAG: cation diffusion facilitator family transporter [Treponema sp.]|jgi:cation diffusion facilitator family transporter|nr:cation diffusion facilitator family transporter [Treponema sp.]